MSVFVLEGQDGECNPPFKLCGKKIDVPGVRTVRELEAHVENSLYEEGWFKPDLILTFATNPFQVPVVDKNLNIPYDLAPENVLSLDTEVPLDPVSPYFVLVSKLERQIPSAPATDMVAAPSTVV